MKKILNKLGDFFLGGPGFVGEPWPTPDHTLPEPPASVVKRHQEIPLPPGVPLPDTTSATWPHVFAFACAMEYKLSLNRRKGDAAGWRKSNTYHLLQRLVQESIELEGALDKYCTEWDFKHQELNSAGRLAITFEAADVANFAMMISDTVHHRQWPDK